MHIVTYDSSFSGEGEQGEDASRLQCTICCARQNSTSTMRAMQDNAFIAVGAHVVARVWGVGKRPRTCGGAGAGVFVSVQRQRRAIPARMDTSYVPADEDRPEGVPQIPTELTLSQQLLMKQYEDQVSRMTKAECQDLALEVARQMIVKDNILRTMLKKDVEFGIEPPDPRDFMEGDDAEERKSS